MSHGTLTAILDGALFGLALAPLIALAILSDPPAVVWLLVAGGVVAALWALADRLDAR